MFSQSILYLAHRSETCRIELRIIVVTPSFSEGLQEDSASMVFDLQPFKQLQASLVVG